MMQNKTRKIYLDYNATAPLRPKAKALMLEILERPHNASSVHEYGRTARKTIEDSREKVAALIGAPANQVIFNSGATEGNNTVLHHFSGEKILVSAIEHPSVLEAAPDAIHIPVTKDGVIDLNALEDLLQSEKPALTSVMLVNNETGAVQPLAEISALAKKYGSLVHSDAVQAAGRIPVDIAALGVDFLTISSHKLGGPQGAGALVLGLCGITPTLLHGGGQEKKARAGTENVAAIAGLGAAAEEALAELSSYTEKMTTLRTAVETGLHKNGTTIHASQVERAPGTTLLSLPGASSETLLMAFDLEGICLSNGSACSSGKVEPSHVLKAMGVPKNISSGTLRISMGWDTDPADIDRFLEVWEKISDRLTDKKQRSA